MQYMEKRVLDYVNYGDTATSAWRDPMRNLALPERYSSFEATSDKSARNLFSAAFIAIRTFPLYTAPKRRSSENIPSISL
jgi:hypothetical protein